MDPMDRLISLLGNPVLDIHQAPGYVLCSLVVPNKIDGHVESGEHT